MIKDNTSSSGSVENPPKYLVLYHQLAKRIQLEEWGDGKVPTVRDIAKEYEVSSFTASRALHLLEEKGLVITRQRSGSYVAQGAHGGGALQSQQTRWAVLLRVSPGPWHEASKAVVKVGFDALPDSEGLFQSSSWDLPSGTNEKTAERTVREIAASGVKGLFFLPSRVSVQDTAVDEAMLATCKSVGLPVVLIDRNLRGEGRPLEYDLITSDHFDGGVQSTRHLLQQGRSAVACVLASPTSSHNDRLGGYLFALQTHGGKMAPTVLWVPPNLEHREIYPWLAGELIRRGIDGVLCYQDYTAVGLIVELLRRGQEVPRQIAVIGCDDLPIGNSFSLGVTTYAYPSKGICQAALKVMRNRIAYPTDSPTKTVIEGRLIVRESSRA